MRAYLAIAILATLTGACGDEPATRPPDASDGMDIDAPDDAIDVDAPEIDASGPDAPVMLTTESTFATGLGSLCGLGYAVPTQHVWLYPCSGATLHEFNAGGLEVFTVTRPGESTDDVDIEIATVAFTLGTTQIAAGEVLFANGETGVTEIYAPAHGSTVTLATAFGESHVVGAAYHPTRNTLFLVHDRNAATTPNTIAEIDPVTGLVLNMFSTLPSFEVNYGDLEVCATSGDLYVVSSTQTTVGVFSPTGTFLGAYPLPADVTSASGIGLDANGGAWISSTSGSVSKIAGLPCGG